MPLDIQPLAAVHHATLIHSKDVADTLAGLEGSYTARDLYARYVSVCREAGREPASQARFSRNVSAYGFASWRTAKTRGWHIHTRWIYATS
jgi:hypothetical protein